MSVRWSVPESDLSESFHTDVNDLLASSAFAWDVTAGFRSKAEQQILYAAHQAGGPLAAPPGRSAHNYGLAVDVAILTPTGPSWDYTADQWQWLWTAVDAHPRLMSGHHFGDDDHIQSSAWLGKRAELRATGQW